MYPDITHLNMTDK